MLKNCRRCNRWFYPPGCGCKLYRIWRPEVDQDEANADTVWAADPYAALEEWAAEDDAASAEYCIANGEFAHVMMRSPDTMAAHEWVVSGEIVAAYHAKKVVADV